MRTHRTVSLLIPVLLAVTSQAAAQQPREWTGRGYGHINIALQTGSQEFPEDLDFELYEDQATVRGTHSVDGGGLFDIGGGVRVWRNLAIGLGFTRSSDQDDVSLAASIPNPVSFTRPPRSETVVAARLDHEETAVHLLAVWVQPLIERVDVAISFGPAFYSAKQDIVDSVTVTELGEPFNRVSVTPAVRESEDSTVGFTIGGDLTYLVTDRLGGGFFLRYSGATGHFLRGQEEVDVDLGGFQIGGGLRVRF